MGPITTTKNDQHDHETHKVYMEHGNTASSQNNQNNEMTDSSWSSNLAEDQGPLVVNLPLLENAASCCKHLSYAMELNNTKEVDAATTTDTNGDNTDASITTEEYECGVSLTGSDSDRQEWSFTLYDFDGHGKITKEDLATLLQTLYDAVGTTVSKQHQNTKALRLRLTLSPDSSKVAKTASADDKTESGVAKGLKANENRKVASKELKVKVNNLLQSEKSNIERVRKNRQDMLMRNNLSPSEKHASVISPESEPKRQSAKNGQETSNQAKEVLSSNSRRVLRSRRCMSHFENPDRRNYYLDLAGMENVDHAIATEAITVASPHLTRHTKRSQLAEQKDIRCSRSQQSPSFPNEKNGTAKRDSCSQEKTFVTLETFTGDTGNCHATTTNCDGMVDSSKCETRRFHRLRCVSCAANSKFHEQSNLHAKPSLDAEGATATGKTAKPDNFSSHYHHRHKHREKNQSRAMRQVIDWLEDAGKATVTPREVILIQRHEHHHIHEYHHHHYHHYTDK